MMSSRSAVPLGVQTPRVAHVPKAVRSDADDAAFLSSAYGLTPDEWQFAVLEGWLGVRSDGRWAASRCGLAVPRQNGKNGVLEIVELFKMVQLGRRVLHTAHEVKTARKAFVRLASFFENERKFPELAALVKEIRKTNGQEAIVLTNGGSCEFVARSKGSGRGFTVDDLVLDEAQELSDDALAALLPTISSAPSKNPQLTMTGTPPGPNMVGEVWTRMRSEGAAGKAPRLCWFEWSVDAPVILDDRDSWAAANPALGIRLDLETVADERDAMDDETFARERLGMWADQLNLSVFGAGNWERSVDRASRIKSHFNFAVDVSKDRSRTAIGVAGMRADGRVHGEFIEESGTAGAADRLAGLVAKWGGTVALDPSSPAGSLIPALAERGIEPRLLSGREVGQACALHYDAVTGDRFRHLGQPALDEAVAGTSRKGLGDEAYRWSRKDSLVNIAPLYAVTFATFLVASEPPEYDVLASAW